MVTAKDGKACSPSFLVEPFVVRKSWDSTQARDAVAPSTNDGTAILVPILTRGHMRKRCAKLGSPRRISRRYHRTRDALHDSTGVDRCRVDAVPTHLESHRATGNCEFRSAETQARS